MKTVNFNVWCQAYYSASLDVHDNFTKEQALEHAKSMLERGFLKEISLNIVPGSSEIDAESLVFEDETE